MLRDRGSMSPSELGERLIVTRATVTGVVDSLERRGYVSRTPNPDDRRSLVIEISEKGLGVLQQVRLTVHQHEKQWLGALSDTELRAYIEQLHRIQDSLAAADDDRDDDDRADDTRLANPQA